MSHNNDEQVVVPAIIDVDALIGMLESDLHQTRRLYGTPAVPKSRSALVQERLIAAQCLRNIKLAMERKTVDLTLCSTEQLAGELMRRSPYAMIVVGKRGKPSDTPTHSMFSKYPEEESGTAWDMATCYHLNTSMLTCMRDYIEGWFARSIELEERNSQIISDEIAKDKPDFTKEDDDFPADGVDC